MQKRMNGELASVKGIVDLTPREALDSAEGFLAAQGYTIEQRTYTTLTAHRRAEASASEGDLLNITVAVAPQSDGGVRMSVRGNDQAGVRERQDAWMEWSESLPKKPEPQIEQAGEGTVEAPDAVLAPPPQPQAVDLPDPPTAPTVTVTSPRRESTVWRGTKLAFGGCVVLPVLLLIGFVGCLAIVASGGGDGGGSESSENKRPTVGIGEPLRVGQVTWTVTSARQATQIEERGFGKYGDTKEGNFIIVDFSFENNSKESITLDPSELTLIDSKNRRSKPDEDTFGYVPSDRDIIYEQVNPGVTREGEVIFTVAPGATDYRLQAGDAVMFTGKSGIVNLSSQP